MLQWLPPSLEWIAGEKKCTLQCYQFPGAGMLRKIPVFWNIFVCVGNKPYADLWWQLVRSSFKCRTHIYRSVGYCIFRSTKTHSSADISFWFCFKIYFYDDCMFTHSVDASERLITACGHNIFIYIHSQHSLSWRNLFLDCTYCCFMHIPSPEADFVD